MKKPETQSLHTKECVKPQCSGKQARAVVLIEFFSQLSQTWRIPFNQIYAWHPILTC